MYEFASAQSLFYNFAHSRVVCGFSISYSYERSRGRVVHCFYSFSHGIGWWRERIYNILKMSRIHLSGFYIATPNGNTEKSHEWWELHIQYCVSMRRRGIYPSLVNMAANPFCQIEFSERFILSLIKKFVNFPPLTRVFRLICYTLPSLLLTLSICLEEQINHPQGEARQTPNNFQRFARKWIILLLMWAPPVLPRNTAIHNPTDNKWLLREAKESSETFCIRNRICPPPKLTMLVIVI